VRWRWPSSASTSAEDRDHLIGTFFQQVLVIANTTRRIDPALLEAAQTLGASRRQLLFRVVVPGVITEILHRHAGAPVAGRTSSWPSSSG